MRIRVLHLSILLFVLVLITGCGEYRRKMPAVPVGLTFDVVYPRLAETDTVFVVPRVDSTFALGSVNPETARVFVNGVAAQVWRNGAFLAYFPLDTASMSYHFLAVSPAGDSLRRELPFQFPVYQKPPETDSLNRILNARLPARITITDDHAVMRTDPRSGYWLFPPRGTEAQADSFSFPYFRVPLTRDLHAWVENRFVLLDTTESSPPKSIVRSLTIKKDSCWTKLFIPLQEPLLFQLTDETGKGPLTLELYGASARIERIAYDPADSLIRDIRWKPLQDDLLQLKIYVNTPHLWGYDAYYEDINLVIALRRAPLIEHHPLEGRIIAVDAGHGGDELGAIGPTRLLEKDPNLKLALRVKTLLKKAGAKVILTRSNDSTVNIYDRVDEAVAQGAELLLSLHNNALADGNNPFELHGSSVYYYQAHSRSLADILHRYLLKATRLPDYGLYYQNLALTRPTQFPAVLIESAFMIHPDEEMLLRNDRFIDRIAKNIVKGLKDYFKEEKRVSERYYHTGFLYGRNIIYPPLWHPLTSQKTYE